jgi:hypothetical protein
MKVRDDISREFWRRAVEQELIQRYEADGYSVVRQERLGDVEADLVARKGKELIVLELKTAATPPERSKSMGSLRKHVVNDLKGAFRLIWIAPPREVEVDIEGIEEKLLQALSDSVPVDVSSLSSYTTIEGVDDVSIESLQLTHQGARVRGEGSVEVDLMNPSEFEGDSGGWAEFFPFVFEIVLDPQLQIVEISNLKVDVSSFYA